MNRLTFLKSMLLIITTIIFYEVHGQPGYQGIAGKTLAESKEWWPQPVSAPANAPNVIWILLDDVGFGTASTFGGLVRTPVFDSLASKGLRYTNFHTAGICAPTRAALLTGRNHHAVHMGAFAHTNLSAGFPGYDGRIPSDKGTIAEILRENGYNTFAVGKWGLTPDEEVTDTGPFDRWPLGKGFDHFLGFLASKTDQYKPDLVEDNQHVPSNGKHLNELITDKAISYISRQIKVAPGKPFFLYYSPGATHAPIQVDSKWIDPYRGKFDEGWDDYRVKVLANQKKMGVIPSNAQLPERNERVTAWNSLSPEEKKLCAKFMEAYAGFLTYTDFEIGRIISYLKKVNQLDNTLIFVMIGDNGASKEGTPFGVVNKVVAIGQKIFPEDALKSSLADSEMIGAPEGKQTNIPVGWAQATNTPFKDWKMDVHAEGAIRNPLIVFYPKGIKDYGGIRNQYGHVIDLLPTTLEMTGIKAPEKIRGISQDTIQGISLYYSVNEPKARSQRTDQHYYIFGSRSVYKDGWKAGAAHRPDYMDLISNPTTPQPDYEKDVWELYNLNEDFNERVNLAKKNPEKLKELKDLFDAKAKKYNVYPFIDWDDVMHKRMHQPATINKK